jgi:uncharacterized protein (TIGR02284 family)
MNEDHAWLRARRGFHDLVHPCPAKLALPQDDSHESQEPTTMSSTDHDIKVLNNLIETTIDSAEGYGEAAKDSENTRYAAAFQQRAAERRQVAQRLQQQVRSLGGTPEDDGSVLAKAHRMFVELRAKMSSKDDTAIVDEVERGEDHIKAKYESALKDNDVTAGTRSLINEAYVSVKSGHDQMRDLKHALHGTH